MALSSSQIYVATYRSPGEDKSKLGPAIAQRTRQHEIGTGSRWRFGRSTTNLRELEPVPSMPPTRNPSPNPGAPKRSIERSASKMSLFNLFSKPKVEKARGHTEVGLAVPLRPQSPAKAAPVMPPPKSSLRHNPAPPAQQNVRARSSQMFRPMSMRPSAAPLKEFGDFYPPPLFQAFPQSVKHATVQACVFPPEVLLRTQSQRRHAEALMERMDSVRDLSVIAEDGSEARKLEKTHRRLISNSVLNPPPPELTNKIYILVTAGYVLQYAGDGPFDRTPEKVLKLGKDSAAFACDLIPGKHWVLQISSRAHDDGTIEPGPKSSLLSRLRSQNAAVRKSATSFLLVLESAEEMDSWMTAVRKEIDNQGGTKVNPDSRRASTSTESYKEKTSSETSSHRYQLHRDPKAPSKIGPVDSPLQSQYGSPKIVTSDWGSTRSERASSVAESTSGQSSRYGNHRQSGESSVATTPLSQDQVQLDQLRGRPRFSFMSTATSVSSPGTRNTSRSTSPVAQSPVQDSHSPVVVEGEVFRSATSLKSFHMNPGNSLSSRRRSMQPLPVTDENFVLPTKSSDRQRHSIQGPTSPSSTETEQQGNVKPVRAFRTPGQQPPQVEAVSTSVSIGEQMPAQHASEKPGQVLNTGPALPQTNEPIGATSYRRSSYNVPPRRDVVSPPPKDPAPLPPPSAVRHSLMGGTSALIPLRSGTVSSSPAIDPRTQRRMSANPKPFLRPLPVRPQQQHADQNHIVPRRLSSLTPLSRPAPLPLRVNVNRSVTAPVMASSTAAPPLTMPSLSQDMMQSITRLDKSVHRPTSGQIRPNPAHLPAATRPVRAVASTPSFVPGRRTSNPTILSSNGQPVQQPVMSPRRSMAAIGLPPPMPPPDLPLPAPPSAMAPATLPNNASSSGPPPSMPLPAPPPTIPLPALPDMAPLPSSHSISVPKGVTV